MANQNRGTQMQQGLNRQDQMQSRADRPNQSQTYYSYSYGYGYYDPYTGDWVEEFYGPFTGAGPLNYQRSDEKIEEDVCDRLTQHGQLDARDVDLSVKGGEVTLNGTVPDRRMKRLAEDIAYNIPGVTDVQNNLRINKQQGQFLPGQQRSLPGQAHNFKSQLKPGMPVLGSDSKSIGTIKEVHDYDFLIDRQLAFDLHVPFSSIESVQNGQVHLDIPSSQIDKMHWGTTTKERAGAR